MSETDPCQYNYTDLMTMTSPDARVALPLRRYWWTLKKAVWHISVLGPSGFAPRTLLPMTLRKMFRGKNENPVYNVDNLNLQPGELVEVRSAKEIFSTLDAQGKLRGLPFTEEMMKFCGRQFKVYKRLQNILLETTGELRRIRTPTVILEGVFCDGEAHGGCDRSCFAFWREAWLKRIPKSPNSTS